MQPNNHRFWQDSGWLEHAASAGTSLVWTAIVLLLIMLVWGYQDTQAQWDLVRTGSTPVRAALQSPHDSPSSSSTPGLPGPPTPAKTPAVIQSPGLGDVLPQVLPETPLEGLAAAYPAAPDRPVAKPSPRAHGTPASKVTETPSSASPDDPTQPQVATAIPTTSNTPLTPSPTPTVVLSATGSVAAADGQVPDRLVIQSVGIDTPVVPVSWTTIQHGAQNVNVWEVADYAAGWHATSARPGDLGNTVFAGHHNIKGEVFRYLVDVQEGDPVDLYVGDAVYHYFVEQKILVKEKDEPLETRQQNAQWIAPTADERVTMVTCWPYTNNTHRVIIVAKPRP